MAMLRVMTIARRSPNAIPTLRRGVWSLLLGAALGLGLVGCDKEVGQDTNAARNQEYEAYLKQREAAYKAEAATQPPATQPALSPAPTPGPGNPAPGPSGGALNSTPKELGDTLAKATALLEAKDYKGYIQLTTHPDKLRIRLQNKTMDDLANDLVKEMSTTPDVVAQFKRMQGETPVLSDNGNTATSSNGMVFLKYGNVWYVK